MKHNTENHQVEKIGQIQEQEFKIRASATSFAILSSDLYSNKILAVVRELSCNAYDSHKESGNKDTPFDITLPSTLHPFLIIKDYGTGLKHEQVMSLYTTYFESTKNDSDDYIGQLGLGSKSPFSYTSQFTVESRQDGYTNVYSMYINEGGVPAVSHMGQQETDEPNGITITIAVKQSDFYKFREAAETALAYFTPYPNVIGDHYRQSVTYRLQKDTWAIRDERVSSYTKSYVIQGFVRYPIDIEQLKSHQSDDCSLTLEGSAILDAPLNFIVPIGLVQVAPSREHLSYDKRTIKNLITFINVVADDITNSLSSMISECDTLWDARIAASTFMRQDSPFRTLYSKLIDKKFKIEYNGVVLNNGFDVSSVDLSGINLHTHYRNRSGYKTRKVESSIFTKNLVDKHKTCNLYNSIHVPVDAKTIVMFNDVNLSGVRIREYVAESDVGTMVLEFRSENKKVDVSGSLPAIYEAIGIDSSEVILVSDLVACGEIYIAPKTAKTKTDRSLQPYWTGGHFSSHVYNSSHWGRTTVDFLTGGYYVYIHRNMWVKNDTSSCSIPHLGKVIQILTDNKIIPVDQLIIGVTSAKAKKFTNAQNWINVFDLYEQFIKSKKDKIVELMISKKLKENLYSAHVLRNFADSLLPVVSKSSPAYSYISEYVNIRDMKHSNNQSILDIFDHIPLSDTTIKSYINAAVDLGLTNSSYNNIYNEYPMIGILHKASSGYVNDVNSMVGIIKDYINLVDSSNTKNDILLQSVQVFDCIEQTV
jgi:hypothetical protein